MTMRKGVMIAVVIVAVLSLAYVVFTFPTTVEAVRTH